MLHNKFNIGLLMSVFGVIGSICFCAEERSFSEQDLNRIVYKNIQCSHKLKHFGRINCVKFNKDGNKALAAGSELVSVWSVYEGEQLLLLDHRKESVADAWFSNDGDYIITKTEKDEVPCYRWSAKSGTLQGPMTSISSAELYKGPDRRSAEYTLAISGLAVLIIDARTNRSVASLNHKKEVVSAEFSYDRTRVISGSIDGTVRIWKAGRSLQELVNAECNRRTLKRVESRRMQEAFERMYS